MNLVTEYLSGLGFYSNYVIHNSMLLPKYAQKDGKAFFRETVFDKLLRYYNQQHKKYKKFNLLKLLNNASINFKSKFNELNINIEIKEFCNKLYIFLPGQIK